ncbi:PqqD family protein [Azospirillum endophyticum]
MDFVSSHDAATSDAVDDVVRLAKSAVADVIDGEAIIVDLDTGTYYSATGFAAKFVEALMGSDRVDAIVGALCRQLGADRQYVLPAVRHVCRQLISFGVLTGTGDGFSGDPVPVEAIPFEGLAISQFTDMKQLLELDPVHQVDESGWPNAANT